MTTRSVALERHRGAKLLDIASRFDCYRLLPGALATDESPSDFEVRCLNVVRQRAAGGSLVRAVEALIASPREAPRYDAETASVVQRWHGEANIEDADPRSLCIPFVDLARMSLQRDLNTSELTDGGGFVGTESRIVDALRPWSVTAQAGVNIVPNVRANQVLPTMVTDPTVSWAPTGGSASTPTLAAAVGAPKLGFGLVNVSRKLRLQSNVEGFLAADLLRVAGRAIDSAVLGGSGTDGEPLGIPNWDGVDAMTGAAITHAVITDGKRDATLAGAPSGAWVSTPTVRALLEQREVIADSGVMVWKDDRMASWPANATPDCPAATLIGGHWPAVFVLLYGAGVTVAANPYDSTLFSKGIVQMRVEIALDVLLPIPSAFTVATGVS